MEAEGTAGRRYDVSAALFLRGLGVVQLIAVGGLLPQIDGLMGDTGITPARDLAGAVSGSMLTRMLSFPSLLWLSTSSAMQHVLLTTGCVAAFALAAGWSQRAALITVWAVYLSFVSFGWVFLQFQWDSLLLEATAVAVLVASPRRGSRALGLLAVRWLLFRLMFGSGVVKLMSGDESWRSFTALDFHYLTQPIPNLVAWYMHRLPHAFHATSCVAMLVIELLVPFFIFARATSVRRSAGAVLAGFQLVLILTGNFAFFNLLTIVLCVPLFDDGFWARVPLLRKVRPPAALEAGPGFIAVGYTALAITLGGALLGSQLGEHGIQQLLRPLHRASAPFGLVNSYGLFAVMTTERLEIEVEGSDDGAAWKPYRFRWKPGPADRPPPQVAPYQPRLDWQMWFAALGDIRSSPWFLRFVEALLQGDAGVLRLLEPGPFDHPPKLVRGLLYRYKFSSRTTLEREGRWWDRELVGVFCPPVSLELFERLRTRASAVQRGAPPAEPATQ